VTRIDVLGIGCAAIDDTIYISGVPPTDGKVRVVAKSRSFGGLTTTALVAAARLGATCNFAGMLGNDPDSILTSASPRRVRNGWIAPCSKRVLNGTPGEGSERGEADRVPLDLDGSGVTGRARGLCSRTLPNAATGWTGHTEIVDPFRLLGEVGRDLVDAVDVDVIELQLPSTKVGLCRSRPGTR
jgi:hypothetical protein